MVTKPAVSEKEIEWTITRMPDLTIHRREQLARKVLVEGCTLKLAAASFA